MKLLTNRIIISLVVIFGVAFLWEWQLRPQTGPYYQAAVNEYNRENYTRSLEYLRLANGIDPNDTSILALMGWNELKLGNPQAAEPHFQRAYKLAPDVEDIILGYSYTELALGKDEEATVLLARLEKPGAEYEDVHIARGTLMRGAGQNLKAAEEFRQALADDPKNTVALKNLREIYDVSGDPRKVSFSFAPLERPASLTYPVRTEGDYFAFRSGSAWKATFLRGVNLTAVMPGHFPSTPGTDPAKYSDWLEQIKSLGANSIRVATLLTPGFYRALEAHNRGSAQSPLWLVQGVTFVDPPENNLFAAGYQESCKKEIERVIDAMHGQGDVASSPLHPGGVYTSNVASWVAGIVIGRTWPSYIVVDTDRLNADQRSFQGTYVEVSSGTPTEVFLAQLLDHATSYEVEKYNWQHPVAFLNWPTLDPMRHPTETAMLEEVRIRRSLGERVETPPGPYENDDEVSVNPNHLQAQQALEAGYFAAYNVLPYYPDFLNYDPGYRATRDAEGPNPLLGYLRDLKRNHRGLPLLITEYGIPTSLGIGHFNPGGLNEGGLTERQQGEMLVRFTRNIYDVGAAGGLVFEWLNEWYRHSWIVRNFETPIDDASRWANFMDPSEYFGVLAVDSHLRSVHDLSGKADEWAGTAPVYAEAGAGQVQPVGDRFDPARDLKALYVDADEGFLYLRLVVGKLDNDGNGQPDWEQVNYLIGLSTLPEKAGLTYLPFIAPVRFPRGMTYAIQLAGPEFSRILIADSYNPFTINQVPGLPAQTELGPKLSWTPSLSESGSFESQIVEPNRRRFGRDRQYFPPQRYDRGILRYGSLDPRAPDYDSLATWRANVQTNVIDLRIPWALLNVTDPSAHLVFAGLTSDGTVETAETPGFALAAFSYRPRESALLRPIMEQGHAVADSLPKLAGPTSLPPDLLKSYLWAGWALPEFKIRPKDSYPQLRRAFTSLPASPPGRQAAAGGQR
jgi:Flp pilus assembly protein TadD